MRRKDREILDPAEIDRVINSCDCCRLGLADGGRVYIVPLSFGFAHDEAGRRFYFHCAGEGLKLDLIRKTGRAGFELDTNHQPIPADTACGHSLSFESVIGSGPVSEVEDPGEKEAALRRIMGQNTGREDWAFEPKHLASVTVLRLDVEEISCKSRR